MSKKFCRLKIERGSERAKNRGSLEESSGQHANVSRVGERVGEREMGHEERKKWGGKQVDGWKNRPGPRGLVDTSALGWPEELLECQNVFFKTDVSYRDQNRNPKFFCFERVQCFSGLCLH